jgi:hypothetical protein
MTKDDAREAPPFGRYDKIGRDAPTFRTSIGNIMYADAVPSNDSNFFNIKGYVLVIVKQTA